MKDILSGYDFLAGYNFQQPVYLEGGNDRINMFSTLQVNRENMNDLWSGSWQTIIDTNSTRKVASIERGALSLSVVSSNSTDTPAQLRKYLELFYNIIVFKSLKLHKNISKSAEPLVKELNNLLQSYQPALVGGFDAFMYQTMMGVEQFQKPIIKYTSGTNEILHTLLFRKHKIVTIQSNPSFTIQPHDIFNLILYANANTKSSLRAKSNTYVSSKKQKDEIQISASVPNISSFVGEFAAPSSTTNQEPSSSNDSDEQQSSTPKIVQRQVFDPAYIYVDSERINCRVNLYRYELGRDIRLVFVCENRNSVKTLQACQLAGARIQNKLSNLLDFVQYGGGFLAMRQFVEQCPGLLHFIFVDCIRHRVLAPSLETLSGVYTDKLLKHHIWRCVSTIASFKERGYTEATIANPLMQYVYTSFLTNSNQEEMPLNSSNLSNAHGHYELYALYLPFLSPDAVRTLNQRLVKQLNYTDLLVKTPKRK